MLIKVGDGNGGWFWFDNIGSANIRSEVKFAKSIEEVESLWGDDIPELNLIAKSCFDGAVEVPIAILAFEKNTGKKRSAFVSSEVYICNDTGDTLEKISVPRLAGRT